MIGPGGLKIGIQVGIRTRVFNCVVSECLMKTFSIEDTFTPCQRVHKILDFSDTILRKSLDFLDQFLLLHARNYSTRVLDLCRSRHTQVRYSAVSFQHSYRISETEIVIVAVAHQKRCPGYWLARIDQR